MNFDTSLELSKKLKEGGCDLKITHQEEPDSEYPSYHILEEICCTHAKEFFGERLYKTDLFKYEYYSREVLALLQKGRKDLAEDYIWENCLFNK